MHIKIGIVGARGLSNMIGFNANPETEVVALCDLDEDYLLEQAQKYGIPKTFRIYEDMLQSDIDAVVISTPMQLHVPQAILALQAGKHVMCEVTAGVTMDELWWLKEEVERSGKVYMLAENYCYMPEHQMISNMVKQGVFGELYYGEGAYIHDCRHLANQNNRPGAEQSSHKSWRHYWQYGKRGTMYPTHSLGPLMQWFGDDRIASISTFGSGWHTEKKFRQEDTSLTVCQLESGKLLNIRLDVISKRPHNMTYYGLQGTKGCFEAPRGLGDQHKVWLDQFEGDERDPQWRPLQELAAAYLPERYQQVTEEQKTAGHNGGDFFIVEDFVEAIKGMRKPAIDVYDACEWTAVALLSELSVTNGGRRMEMPNFRQSTSYQDQIIKL